jgi:hypothetical protein
MPGARLMAPENTGFFRELEHCHILTCPLCQESHHGAEPCPKDGQPRSDAPATGDEDDGDTE